MNQYSETELRNHGTVEMYDESGYFDPSMVDNPIQLPAYNNINLSHNEGMEDNNIRVSTYSLDDLSNSNHHLSDEAAAAAMGLDHLHHHLGLDLEHELHSHLIQHQEPPMESANWDPTMQEQQNVQCYSAAPDLLNLLQLPRCTVAPPVFPPTGSISFGGPSLNVGDGGSVLYDSSLHLGYPPPQLRDLFSSLPQNYGLFCGVEERGDAGVYQEMDGMQFDSTVLDYRREVKGEVKGSFVTERHRREQLNEKYKTLRSLIPNPTKSDRASIVGDAIECIKELGRTVEELKILVDQKRRRERRSMQKTEDEAGAGDMESSSMRPLRDDPDRPLNGALRSSWLQRKSKDSFVDVRIVDDEVNIKLTQKRKASCLISVAKALDELQLDLVHVTGGNVVDHHIFMLNAKICEGSSVYAGAIAKKLLEVMDRQHQTLTFADSF